MTNDERLAKVEERIRGMEVGQEALREHIDNRLDSLSEQVVSRDQELPISAPVWSFVVLSASTAALALIQLFLLIDMYLL